MVCTVIFPTKTFECSDDSVEFIEHSLMKLIQENQNINRICTLFNFYVYTNDIDENNIKTNNLKSENENTKLYLVESNNEINVLKNIY
jgi:hypothetical protein